MVTARPVSAAAFQHVRLVDIPANVDVFVAHYLSVVVLLRVEHFFGCASRRRVLR